jgi:hypothetical protein
MAPQASELPLRLRRTVPLGLHLRQVELPVLRRLSSCGAPSHRRLRVSSRVPNVRACESQLLNRLWLEAAAGLARDALSGHVQALIVRRRVAVASKKP